MMSDGVKKSKRDETEEERRARKERERAERREREKNTFGAGVDSATTEQKRKREETEEERRARKERERAERREREKNTFGAGVDSATTEQKRKREETEEERRARKERERAERREREKNTFGAGVDSATTEQKRKREETEEERRARKERERAERKEREKAVRQQQQEQQHHEGTEDKAEPTFVCEDKVKEDRHHGWPTEGREVHSSSLVPGGTKEEIAAAMDLENVAIRQAAEEARNVVRREERLRDKEEHERQASERQEKRRKEREEKRAQRPQSSDTADTVVGTSALGVSDLQRQGYRMQFEKDLQRATALRRLVDMDDASAALVDVPPQSQYDIYIRNFGDTGRKQVEVQVPAEEDRMDVEVQADRVRLRHIGVEVPRDLGLCPERSADSAGHFLKGAAHDGVVGALGKGSEADEAALGEGSGLKVVDGVLLAAFLGCVFPVMRAILDENEEERVGSEAVRSKSETQFSTSYTTFCFEATRNRPVIKVLFNPCNPAYVGVLHGVKEADGPSKELDRYPSVIVLWDVYDPSAPEKVLVSPSVLTSFCMSPRWFYLVYAGAEDGSLYVWDTREPERNHFTVGRYQRNTFRLPSFSTSWQTGNHTAPIVTVAVAGYNTAVGIRKDESEQLVSLDASGMIFFWFVNDKDQSKGTISDTENGLHMFSTVRLFLATSRNEDQTGLLSVKQESFALDFVPADPSHYVVACAEGVRHISRFRSIAAPSLYGPSSRFFSRPVAIPSCVRYNTLDSRILMVGYDDGNVRLYLHTDGAPQLSISLSTHRIIDICCSGLNKWLVWFLDASGTLYLLDLAKKEKEFPLISQNLLHPDTGCCTCFDIPPEGKVDLRVIVLGFEKGVIQLHTLNDFMHLSGSDREEHWL